MQIAQRMALLSGLTLVVTAFGQFDAQPPQERDTEEKKPLLQFNVTDQLLQNFLHRMVDDGLNRVYNFDDYQSYQTKQLMTEKIPAWVAENSDRIGPLVTQYLEAISADTPPSPEMVANWASEAQALRESFMGVVDNVTTEMRTYLNEDQQIILDGELAAWNVANGFIDQRLEVWAEGGFNPETDWPRGSQFRTTQRERDQMAQQEINEARQAVLAGDMTLQEARGSVATEQRTRDEWTKYVEAFIKKYNLDTTQQQQARRLLANAQEQRDNWLLVRGREFDRIEEKLASAETDEKKAQWLKRYEDLIGPVNKMEERLKSGLDKLPTRAQRKAVIEAERAKEEAGSDNEGETVSANALQ
jgi:hypothetical protein